MSGLDFEVVGVRAADRSALAPTLQVRLRLTGVPGQQVQSILLRCQIRIEPERRRYDAAEQGRLLELFGEPHRWSETVKPFLLTHVVLPVGGFVGTTEVDMPVELSYDLEVATGRYLHALRDGLVPLLLLFSGTVFSRTPQGLQVEQIPWDREARFDLPVATWHATIDAHHPGTGWLRLTRDTIDALQDYKSRNGIMTFDETLTALLAAADPSPPGAGDADGATTPADGVARNGDLRRVTNGSGSAGERP